MASSDWRLLRTKVLAVAAVLLTAVELTYAMTRALGPPVEASAWVSAAWVGALTLFVLDRKFLALAMAGLALIASMNWLAIVVRC